MGGRIKNEKILFLIRKWKITLKKKIQDLKKIAGIKVFSPRNLFSQTYTQTHTKKKKEKKQYFLKSNVSGNKVTPTIIDKIILSS